MKPDTVKILTISTSYEPKILGTAIYGLGDDEIVYLWNKSDSTWLAYTNTVVIAVVTGFGGIDGSETNETQP